MSDLEKALLNLSSQQLKLQLALRGLRYLIDNPIKQSAAGGSHEKDTLPARPA